MLTYRDVETGGAAVPSIERRVRDGQLRWYARFRDSAGAQKVKVFTSSSGRPLTKAIAGHEFDAIERTVDFTGSPHSLQRYLGASLISRGVSVVAVSRWLGHPSPEITYRVYAHRKPDDEPAGRDATAKTMRQLLPQMYPMCTEKGAE
jgi:integrase